MKKIVLLIYLVLTATFVSAQRDRFLKLSDTLTGKPIANYVANHAGSGGGGGGTGPTPIYASPGVKQSAFMNISGLITSGGAYFGGPESNIQALINSNGTTAYSGFAFNAVDQIGQIQLRHQPALGRGLRIYDPANPTNTGIGNNDWKRVLVEGDVPGYNEVIANQDGSVQSARIRINGDIQGMDLYGRNGGFTNSVNIANLLSVDKIAIGTLDEETDDITNTTIVTRSSIGKLKAINSALLLQLRPIMIMALPVIDHVEDLTGLPAYTPYRTSDGFIKYKLP